MRYAAGKELLTLKAKSFINSVAFSPDGTRIVIGSADKTAKVWDVLSAKELLTLKEDSSLKSVAFSPDGRRIATGSSANTVKVWDAQTGEELCAVKGHFSNVMSIAFSPNGTRIVTGSADKTVKVWDFSDIVSPNHSPNGTAAQKLTRVFVRKYGFSVLLPTEFFPDAATKLTDANADQLVSANGCFRVAFKVVPGPAKKAYENCIAEFGKKANHTTIDYKVQKENWFVVSGDSDSTGYYTKGVMRGDNVIVMELEYAGDACNIPDAMLTEISHKFDGN